MSNDIGAAETSVLLESFDWAESKNIASAVRIPLQALSAGKNSVGRSAASGRLRTVGTAQCTRLLPEEQLGVLSGVLEHLYRNRSTYRQEAQSGQRRAGQGIACAAAAVPERVHTAANSANEKAVFARTQPMKKPESCARQDSGLGCPANRRLTIRIQFNQL